MTSDMEEATAFDRISQELVNNRLICIAEGDWDEAFDVATATLPHLDASRNAFPWAIVEALATVSKRQGSKAASGFAFQPWPKGSWCSKNDGVGAAHRIEKRFSPDDQPRNRIHRRKPSGATSLRNTLESAPFCGCSSMVERQLPKLHTRFGSALRSLRTVQDDRRGQLAFLGDLRK
jgi:hypothetical protein